MCTNNKWVISSEYTFDYICMENDLIWQDRLIWLVGLLRVIFHIRISIGKHWLVSSLDPVSWEAKRDRLRHSPPPPHNRLRTAWVVWSPDRVMWSWDQGCVIDRRRYMMCPSESPKLRWRSTNSGQFLTPVEKPFTVADFSFRFLYEQYSRRFLDIMAFHGAPGGNREGLL